MKTIFIAIIGLIVFSLFTGAQASSCKSKHNKKLQITQTQQQQTDLIRKQQQYKAKIQKQQQNLRNQQIKSYQRSQQNQQNIRNLQKQNQQILNQDAPQQTPRPNR